MTNDLRFAARPLDVVDVPAALDLSLDAGAHGVYVHNVLVALLKTTLRSDRCIDGIWSGNYKTQEVTHELLQS